MMGPRNDAVVGDYITLLGMIRHQDRTYIRHDIDHCILKAIKLAVLEHAHEYISTFFLLPTAPYFDYSNKFVDQINAITELGHYIGLHNNGLTEHLRDGVPLADTITKPLSFLREHVDNVWLTAAHGDKWLKERHLINYQMWKEADEPWTGPTQSLRAYSLMETYFMEKAYYLSDSGGRWRGGPGKTGFEDVYEPCNPIELIQTFNKTDDGMLEVLVHPYWWE